MISQPPTLRKSKDFYPSQWNFMSTFPSDSLSYMESHILIRIFGYNLDEKSCDA
jgi:hypothetical protein